MGPWTGGPWGLRRETLLLLLLLRIVWVLLSVLLVTKLLLPRVRTGVRWRWVILLRRWVILLRRWRIHVLVRQRVIGRSLALLRHLESPSGRLALLHFRNYCAHELLRLISPACTHYFIVIFFYVLRRKSPYCNPYELPLVVWPCPPSWSYRGLSRVR